MCLAVLCTPNAMTCALYWRVCGHGRRDGVQRSWNSYQRLFYDQGFINIEDLKRIRNEMDLLVSTCSH